VTESAESSRRAVLLVGHGTRDQEGTRQFFQLGDRLAARLRPISVRPSLLEFQRPTIAEAWAELVAGGATHVHVVPLLLFAAGHAKQDIPEAIAQCQRQTPQVSADQTRPLSRHRGIIELVVQRLAATWGKFDQSEHGQTQPARTALIMVGRGNRDPCAQADMRVLSQVVGRRVDVGGVFTAFYAMAEPRLPAVIDRVAGSGDYDRIVIHPHLLFEGRLFQSIAGQVNDAAARHPGQQIVLSPYLGPDPLVADAIAGRIEQLSTSGGK
jgi:sirohydrochlorin cobaltochelatase